MSLNRRRFVLLSGLTIGTAALGAAYQKSIAQSNSQDNPQANSQANPQADSHASFTTSTGTAVGPADLFAPNRGDIRFAVISDFNSGYGSVSYLPEVGKGISLLPDWQPDMVICGGDMVAGQSLDLSQSQIAAMWDAFDEQILAPIRSASLPFALTVGNHDASSYQENGPNGKAFVYVLDRQESSKYWAAHQSETALSFVEASGFPYYYSFTQNDIFFLVWDASSANIPPEQVAWADRALSSPEAQTAKLRIVMGHLPMYAVSKRRDRPGEYLNQADELRQLLERHNVHTYISGHHHAYFPGKVGALNLLNLGALGSGPKSILATNVEPFQTLTIMDLFLESGSTVYTTYNMNTLEVVDPQALPRQIVGPNGRELRQDISLTDLTAAEQAQAYIPSET
jgi:hypothetical protein